MSTITPTPLATKAATKTATKAATKATLRNYSPAIAELCDQLYFRQSMLKDYLTCPMMMMYRWIIGHEEEDTFFASVLGIAGHRVIEHMHSTGNFNLPFLEIMSLFLKEFRMAVQDSAVPPRLSSKYETLTAQAEAVSHEYCAMLSGYQKDPLNQKFYATVIEQSFCLPLQDEFGRDFYFTGTIDQAGFYDDGNFALRDIKFRINEFRPGPTEAKLDMQLTLYSLAIKEGYPACSQCRPRYTTQPEQEDSNPSRPQETKHLLGSDTIPDTPVLTYQGPCAKCTQLIGTPKWPQLIPIQTELIWMRDYIPRQRDQHTKFIPHPDGEKEFNPQTRRMRIKQIINPKYIEGYKKGEPTGSGHIVTERPAAFLQVRAADIVRLAGMIRDGRFYRKEGPHCNFWCKFRDPCLSMLEMEVEQIDVNQFVNNAATIDPFGE